MVDKSVEAQFEQMASRGAVLGRMSREAAWAGDSLRAVFLAVTGDFLVLREVVLEANAVDPDGLAEAMVQLMELVPAAANNAARTANAHSAYDLVDDFRAAMLDTLDADLRRRALQLLPPLDYLHEVAPPDAHDLDEFRANRLLGLSPAEFVEARRAAGRKGIDHALALDAAGDVQASIAAGYAADMEWLEAYLVESALTVGDDAMLTTELRWLLMLEAIRNMGQVPERGRDAAKKVRYTLASCMCEAEEERLSAVWVPLPD